MPEFAGAPGMEAGRRESRRVPVIFERFDGAKFVRFGRRKCSVGKWLRQETDQLAACYQPLCLSSNSAICTQIPGQKLLGSGRLCLPAHLAGL